MQYITTNHMVRCIPGIGGGDFYDDDDNGEDNDNEDDNHNNDDNDKNDNEMTSFFDTTTNLGLMHFWQSVGVISTMTTAINKMRTTTAMTTMLITMTTTTTMRLQRR